MGVEPAPHPLPVPDLELSFRVELVAALREGGTDIPVEAALDCVYGYAIAST